MLQVGQVVCFEYDGKDRHVKVEKVTENYFVGWDYNADHPVGGYRTFSFAKIEPFGLIEA
jgi:hypothetical protein